VTRPLVDVIIPVHTDRRPIARATASVLASATVETRVNVVCHNVETELIRTALGDWSTHPAVRLLSLVDGIASPAGPINAGLDAATAEFTTLLGSDDEYEPGAVDAWMAVARRDDADVVIPPLRSTPGGPTKSPPTRPWRSRRLDGVRDRLAYRTVQLGLIRRDRFPDLRMTTGLRSGEDVIQGATLWYSGASISLLRRGPGYLIHEDAPEQRVSSAPKPAAESFGFLDAVLDPEFTRRLSLAQREAFAVKLLRTHVMDILGAALQTGSRQDDLDTLRVAVRRILGVAPSAIDIVSRRDARILRGLMSGIDPSALAKEHAAHADYRRADRLLGNLLPDAPSRMLHREAPPRYLAATALMR
jgi:hypothetical protein